MNTNRVMNKTLIIVAALLPTLCAAADAAPWARQQEFANEILAAHGWDDLRRQMLSFEEREAALGRANQLLADPALSENRRAWLQIHCTRANNDINFDRAREARRQEQARAPQFNPVWDGLKFAFWLSAGCALVGWCTYKLVKWAEKKEEKPA